MKNFYTDPKNPDKEWFLLSIAAYQITLKLSGLKQPNCF